MKKYKFKVGQLVDVLGVKCRIIKRDMEEGTPDYLCKPLDETIMVDGQWELGPGWVREPNLSEV